MNGGAAYAAPSSGTATISYTVKDQFGVTATGGAAVTVDTGPALKSQAPALTRLATPRQATALFR